MITVYTKDFCPYCVQAKRQLDTMGFEYQEVNIETDAKTRNWLVEQGHRTMPQLYYDGKLLVEGGAQGLAKLSKDEIKTALGEFDFDISMKL